MAFSEKVKGVEAKGLLYRHLQKRKKRERERERADERAWSHPVCLDAARRLRRGIAGGKEAQRPTMTGRWSSAAGRRWCAG